MSIPASVLSTTQIGVEATPGTAVAATDILAASSVTFDFNVDIEEFRAAGYKTLTGTIFNDEMSSFSLAGKPTYHELVYWLNTILDTGVITTPGGATNARLHTFIPDPDGADALKTLTIEKSNSVRSYEVPHCMLNQLTFTVRRSPGGSSIDISGSGFGQEITDGITPTGSLSQLPFVPMIPNQFGFYIDDTAAGLGTTGITDTFEVSWSYGPKFNQFRSLDSSEPSFTGIYEVATPSTMTVRFPRNATSSAFLAAMRAGSTRFLRLEATGATDAIESGETYMFTLDFAGQIMQPALGDQDGLETISYTFTNVNDPTWGQSMEVVVENDLAAL